MSKKRRIEFDDDFESFMFDMGGDPDIANSVIDSIYAAQTEHLGNGYVADVREDRMDRD